jgi:hypothetical protein
MRPPIASMFARWLAALHATASSSSRAASISSSVPPRDATLRDDVLSALRIAEENDSQAAFAGTSGDPHLVRIASWSRSSSSRRSPTENGADNSTVGNGAGWAANSLFRVIDQLGANDRLWRSSRSAAGAPSRK